MQCDKINSCTHFVAFTAQLQWFSDMLVLEGLSLLLANAVTVSLFDFSIFPYLRTKFMLCEQLLKVDFSYNSFFSDYYKILYDPYIIFKYSQELLLSGLVSIEKIISSLQDISLISKELKAKGFFDGGTNKVVELKIEYDIGSISSAIMVKNFKNIKFNVDCLTIKADQTTEMRLDLKIEENEKIDCFSALVWPEALILNHKDELDLFQFYSETDLLYLKENTYVVI